MFLLSPFELDNMLTLDVSDVWMNSKVFGETGPAPERPLSDPVTLYRAISITNCSSIYAAAPPPYHYLTGKSLVMTFTNHPNIIQAINVGKFPQSV